MFVVAKGAKTFQVGHFHVKLTGVHNKLIDNYMRKKTVQNYLLDIIMIIHKKTMTLGKYTVSGVYRA